MHGMRAAAGFVLTCLIAGPAAGQEPAGLPCHPALDALRSAVPGLMDSAGVPGLAVAVVRADGETLWEEAFGTIAQERDEPVTPATLFSLQSISKVLTATAVLAAVRDGLVDLDTPITRYLPELRLRSRHEDRPEERVTLRLLLSHHAGLTHEAPVGNNYEWEAVPSADHAASIERTWLRFPVGQRYSYSNLGIDLAGRVLEAVSGRPFPAYVRDHVLEPLGLTRTTFDPTAILTADDRATGSSTGFDSIPVVTPMMPSGGAWATAADLARLGRLHLGLGEIDGRRILPASLVAEAHTIHRSLPGQTRGYGLGIAVETTDGGRRLLHDGSGFGFRTALTLDADRGLVVAVLTNADGHSVHTVLTEAILAAMTEPAGARTAGQPEPPGHRKTAGDTRGAARPMPGPDSRRSPAADRLRHDSTLAGTYLYGSGGWMYVLWKAGHLGVGTPDRFTPFHFTSEDEAWHEAGGERFHYRFVRSEDGRPAYLIRLYDGTWLDYLDPTAAGGPPPAHWSALEGRWRRRRWGRPLDPFTIEGRGGRLWLDHMPLEEHLPGLFFTPHGEALDFTGAVPTWRSIPIERVPAG